MPDIREGRPLTEGELHDLIALVIIGGRNIIGAPVRRCDGSPANLAETLNARITAYHRQISLLEVYRIAPDMIRAEIKGAAQMREANQQPLDDPR